MKSNIAPIISEREKLQMHQYLLLMEEARLRFDVINRAHQNNAELLPQMVREICYLQFRFLCEIIALACLVAQGNIPKRLMQTYEATKILNEMEKLNPNFYPQPFDLTRNGNTVEMRRSDRVHLTRENLVELWGRSGDTLHRSPLAKYAKLRSRNPADFSDIFDWSEKLTGLLNSHLIAISDTRSLVVNLADPETGKPRASILNYLLETNTVNISTFKVV